MPALLVEARHDQPAHPEQAHVAQGQGLAGFVVVHSLDWALVVNASRRLVPVRPDVCAHRPALLADHLRSK